MATLLYVEIVCFMPINNFNRRQVTNGHMLPLNSFQPYTYNSLLTRQWIARQRQ